MNRFAFALLVFAGTACSSNGGDGTNPFPTSPYANFATDSGSYRIAMRTSPSQPPVRGVLQVELRVTDADGKPADGLSIAAVPWMPSHGHGSSVEPIVTPEGSGIYEIDDVSLYMPGTWQLRLTVGDDHALQDIEVQ